jgi:hypothetical protein
MNKNKHLPNCYCIPLFCRDEKTQKNSEFEKIIREKLGKTDDTEFDYSYTSKFEFFLLELQDPTFNIFAVFNRMAFDFRCIMTFTKRNISNGTSFIANIFFQEYIIKDSYIMSLFFIYNDSKLQEIIRDFYDNIVAILSKISLGFFLIIIPLGIFLFYYIYRSCNKMIEKMNTFKNIRKVITQNSAKKNESLIKKETDNDINKSSKTLLNDKNNKNMNKMKSNENDNLIDIEDDKEKKNEKVKDKNDFDELDELINLVNDNINLFNIEFSLNEELNDNITNIKKQYNEIIQVNKYKNKLLLNDNKEEIIFNNNEDSSFSSNNSKHIKKNHTKNDISVNIFCELLSLSNHKFDFSNIKTNFYYKENNDNSLYNLKEIVANISETSNSNESFEITNIERLKNALKHYYNNIHAYWKNDYDLKKKKDEI